MLTSSLVLPLIVFLSQALAPTISGDATWYCSDGRDGSDQSDCTRGYGPGDLVAAIDRKDSPFELGDRVRVIHGDRDIVVTIVDVCACPGDRIIDLTIGAFEQLGDWRSGVLPVRLEPTEAAPTLPPTDA